MAKYDALREAHRHVLDSLEYIKAALHESKKTYSDDPTIKFDARIASEHLERAVKALQSEVTR